MPACKPADVPAAALRDPGPAFGPSEHVRLIHPHGRGCVTMAVNSYGSWGEKAVPCHDAAGVAALLDGAEDAYMGTQPMKGWRGVARVLCLRTFMADLDTYRVPSLAGLSPEAVAVLVLGFLRERGRPEPTLITFTGRGLAVWWSFDDVPACALPRWQAMEGRLVAELEPFGADPAATDAARVMRLVGTVNSKSGRTVRALHMGPRHTFGAMADAILPYTREQVREMREQAARRRQERERSPAGMAAQESRVVPRLTRATWAATLADDLRRLHAHRCGGSPVEPGQRDLFMFCMAIAAVHAGTPADAAEVVRTAGPLVGWTGERAVRKMVTTLRKGRQACTGGKVEYAGRQVDPRYTPRAATMMAWLGVTACEARAAGLRLLAPREVRQEQERARWHVRREEAGGMAREDYLAAAAGRAARAATLRGEGMPWSAVAEAVGLASGDAARKLARRAPATAAQAQGTIEEQAVKPDRCLRVSSGEAPQEAAPVLPPRAPHPVRAVPPARVRRPRKVAAPYVLSPAEQAARDDARMVKAYRNHAALMRKRGAVPMRPPAIQDRRTASPEVLAALRDAEAAMEEAVRHQEDRSRRLQQQERKDARLSDFAEWAREGRHDLHRNFLAVQEARWRHITGRATDDGQEALAQAFVRRAVAFRRYATEWRAALASTRPGVGAQRAAECVAGAEATGAAASAATSQAAIPRLPAPQPSRRFRVVPDALDLLAAKAA